MLTAVQRRWGIAAARANAQLLLDRLGFVGRGAWAADARRMSARAARRRRAVLVHRWRHL
eukprot:11366875-Karenia_brevis.AAC.1